MTTESTSLAASAPARAQPARSPWLVRLRTHARTKALLFVALNVWICAPYYGIQRLRWFEPTPMEPGAFDRMVPFQSGWAWVYLSLFLLIPAPPLLLTDVRRLWRLVLEMAVLSLVSNAIFLAWPTSIARPPAEGTSFAWRLVTSTDLPLNACPSLHASLAVFSALWFGTLLREWQVGSWARAALWGWTLAILWATLATKQHVLVDLLAGAALALAVTGAGRALARRDAASSGARA